MTNTTPTPIFIIAGEVSGDQFAADLMAELSKKKPTTFIGCGGKKMREQGLMGISEDNSLFSSIGYLEAIGFLWKHFSLLNKIIPSIKKYKCKHVILVDHETFNIMVAKKIRKVFGNSVKIYFYIAPRVSMWGMKNASVVGNLCDAIFCYMQPDLPIYLAHNRNSFFFGSPLAKRLKTFIPTPKFFEKHGLNKEKQYIALMPGSRYQEIKQLLPVFLQTALRLYLERNVHFLMTISHPDLQQTIQKQIKKARLDHCIHIVKDSSLEIMHHCTAGFVSAGTVTLESVMMGMYPVIAYRVSDFTFYSIKKSEKLGDETLIGLPNVFLRKRIFPELLQFEVNPERLYEEIIFYLDMRTEMKQYVIGDSQEKLSDALGSVDSVVHVADYIVKQIEGFHG